MAFLNDLVAKYRQFLEPAAQSAGQTLSTIGNAVGQGIQQRMQPPPMPRMPQMQMPKFQPPAARQLQNYISQRLQNPMDTASRLTNPTQRLLSDVAKRPGVQNTLKSVANNLSPTNYDTPVVGGIRRASKDVLGTPNYVTAFDQNADPATRRQAFTDFSLSFNPSATVQKVGDKAGAVVEDILKSGYREIGTLTKPAAKPFKARIDEIYTNWVDRFNPINQLVDVAEGVAKNKGFSIRPEFNPKFQIKRFLGMSGIAQQQIDSELKPILNQLDQFKIPQQDIDLYLKSRRDINLGQRGIKGSDSVLGGQRAQLLEQKYGPQLGQVADQLYAYQNKNFDELVSAGFIKPDVAESIKGVNVDYVPFQRVLEDQVDEFLGIPSKSAQQSANPVSKIKGSDKQIFSPIESVIANTIKQRAAIEKNKVAQTIVGLQDMIPDIGFKQVGKSGSDSITVWKDGAKQFWQVGQDIADSVKGMNEETTNSFLKVLSIPSNILRRGATGQNPEFIIPNLVRDQLEAGVNSQYGYVPFLDYFRGLAHLIKQDFGGGDDLYQAWMKAGGAQVFGSLTGRESVKNSIQAAQGKKNLFGWLNDGLNALGRYSETPTRLGLFNKGIQKTGNTAMAAMESREGTLDFARMGAKMRVANSLIPFLNVGIQGFDRLARTAKANPGAFTAKMALFGAMPSITTTLYNVMTHPEEYFEIPQYDKDANFVLVSGRNADGTVSYTKIPKAQSVQFVANPLENLLSYAYQTTPKSLDQLAFQFLGSSLPVIGEGSSPKELAIKTIGANLPQAIKPVTETLLNKSFYKYNDKTAQAKEVVPNFLNKLPAGDRSYEWTPAAYKAVGKTLNVSPLQVQNLLDGYFAGYTKIPAQIVDALVKVSRNEQIDPSELTGIRRFMGRTLPATKNTVTRADFTGSIAGSIVPNNQRAGLLQTASAAEVPGSYVAEPKQFINQIRQDNVVTPTEKQLAKDRIAELNRQRKAVLGNTRLPSTERDKTANEIDAARKILSDGIKQSGKVDYATAALTGQYEVDKVILSKKTGALTTQINRLTEQAISGELEPAEAAAQITELRAQQTAISKQSKALKGGKARIGKAKKPKKIPVSVIKGLSYKPPKAPPIKVVKAAPKGRVYKLTKRSLRTKKLKRLTRSSV